MTPTEGVIITDDFGHWFAGFCDGEACFYIGREGGCQFFLNMRADDAGIIETIHARLGFGRIHYTKDATTDYAIRRPMCRYEVSRKRDSLKIVGIFDRFPLRSRKARDYAIWREAVIAHNSGCGLDELVYYRRDLAEARKYRGPDYVSPRPPRPSVQASLLEDGIAP